MPERKAASLELKADGEVRSVFATFNVVDKDGDVTLPGAFIEGQAVRLLPAHDWRHYAIGKGHISTDYQRATFNGTFNLKTTAGRDWYEAVKDLGAMQEWSYGFDILESEPGTMDGRKVRVLKAVRVHEVSPVTLGAGMGTETLSIKSGSLTEAIEHASSLVTGLQAFAERLRDRSDRRAKEGRALSEVHRTRIKTYLDALRGVAGDMEELLTVTDVNKSQDEIGIALQILYEKTRDQLRRYGAA